MGKILIVDGHNLGFSGAVFLAQDPASPEGRGELCDLLADYAAGKGFILTVVFDGRGSGNTERSRRPFKGGTAVYSSRSETADDVIRNLSRGAPAGTVVVTSDRGLHGTLSGRDVAVISCGEFADRLAAGREGGGREAGADEPGDRRNRGKKGEGHRRKKRERKRESALRKL